MGKGGSMPRCNHLTSELSRRTLHPSYFLDAPGVASRASQNIEGNLPRIPFC